MENFSNDRIRKFGLLGQGISYTLSPQIHEYIFRTMGIRASYSVHDVQRNALASTVHMMLKEYDGFNVTKPYKTDIIQMLDSLNYEALRCLNVNTVHMRKGYNTDFTALIKIFSEKFGYIKDGDCVIFGSGSAASTSAVAFSDMGFSVTLVARDAEKGQNLADHIVDLGHREPKVLGFSSENSMESDVVVNTISSEDVRFPQIDCKVAVNFNYGSRGINFQRMLMMRL